MWGATKRRKKIWKAYPWESFRARGHGIQQGHRTGRVQAAVAIANGDNRAGFGFLIRRARFLVNIGGVFFLGRQV